LSLLQLRARYENLKRPLPDLEVLL